MIDKKALMDIIQTQQIGAIFHYTIIISILNVPILTVDDDNQ